MVKESRNALQQATENKNESKMVEGVSKMSFILTYYLNYILFVTGA